MVTQTSDFTEDIANDFAEEVAIADGLLSAILQEKRQPNYGELTYFRKHLNWDEKEVKRQLHRMTNVLRDLAIAGSRADRDAAAKEAATAAKIFESEGAKIAEQIEKLQAKLRSLESDARLSSKRVEDQNAACVRLRESVPIHVADSVRIKRESITSSLYREILDTETRINELECVLDPSRYQDGERNIFYLEAVQRCSHESVHHAGNGPTRKMALSPQWAVVRPELEKELSALKTKVAEMRPIYQAEIAKIDADLDFYINQRG